MSKSIKFLIALLSMFAVFIAGTYEGARDYAALEAAVKASVIENMCLVSLVVHGAANQLPPLSQWSVQQLSEMQQVIRLLESIDKKLGAKDCLDETKETFLADLDYQIDVCAVADSAEGEDFRTSVEEVKKP